MEKLFINELTFGMVGKDKEYLSSYCAGIIKTGIDSDGICKNAISEKLFSAAARAAAKTGAPVMVYVDKNADAMAVINFFSDHGVTPDRLIFCHLDTVCCNAAVHEAILQLAPTSLTTPQRWAAASHRRWCNAGTSAICY